MMSEDFVEKMRRRMLTSFYKYGPVKAGYPKNVDAISSLKLRLDTYAETGNTEYLIDAANFAMIEFMLPRHKKAHFNPTDSDGSPGRVGGAFTTPTHDSNKRLGGEIVAESIVAEE